jgi:hypothetical protein
MPLPRLNTNIDVSNALFKLADQERVMQEQGKVDAIRNQQLTNANALTQYNTNRLEAARIKDDFDTKIKQIGMIDYSKGVQDHNEFKTWVEGQNPALGKMIPYLDPADTASLQRGKDWQSRSLELLGAHKAGNAPKEVRLVNKSTGEDRIEWAESGKPYTPPKGWSIYNKEDSKDEPVVATESGYQLRKNAIGLKPYQAPRQAPVPPEKDYVKMGVDIGNNLENPAVADMADEYNRNAPGNVMYVPTVYQTQFAGTSTKIPFTTDTSAYKRVDLSDYGVTADQVRAKAKAAGLSESKVAAALIKVIERKRTSK